jgi:subtilisin family serine protease
MANRMLERVYGRGVVTFASAGNQGRDVSLGDFKHWPAKDSPHTVAVGATGPLQCRGDGNVLNDYHDLHMLYSNFNFDPNESVSWSCLQDN